MSFKPAGCNNSSFGVPIIGYVHHTSLGERFEGDLLIEIFEKNPELKENLKKMEADYCIALIWGLDDADCVDLWIYTDVQGKEPMDANPDVDVMIFKDGELGKIPGTTCGDSLIVLGLEEQHRRECQSLDDYLLASANGQLTRWPKLPKYLIGK